MKNGSDDRRGRSWAVGPTVGVNALVAVADRLAPGQQSTVVPADVHAATSDCDDASRLVLLWLTRIRPASRNRYLAVLQDYLSWTGYQGAQDAISHAGRDCDAVHGAVQKFVARHARDRRSRLFAYAALRSFYARSRVPLPTDVAYDVGGEVDEWWLG